MSERHRFAFKTDLLCKYRLIRKIDFERKPTSFSVKRYEASKFFYLWLKTTRFTKSKNPGFHQDRWSHEEFSVGIENGRRHYSPGARGRWPFPPPGCFCISYVRKLIGCIYHCRFSPFVSGAVFVPKGGKKVKKIKCQRWKLWKWDEGLKKYRV